MTTIGGLGTPQGTQPKPGVAAKSTTGPLEHPQAETTPQAPPAAPVTIAPHDDPTLTKRADHAAADRGDDLNIPAGPPATVAHTTASPAGAPATVKHAHLAAQHPSRVSTPPYTIEAVATRPAERFGSVPYLPVAAGPGNRFKDAVEQNKFINNTYHKFDQEFATYLNAKGQKTDVASWFTYGKHASREAGEQIANLKIGLDKLNSIKELSHDLDASWKLVTHTDQLRHLGRDIGDLLDLAAKPGAAGATVRLILAEAGLTPDDIKKLDRVVHGIKERNASDIALDLVKVFASGLGEKILIGLPRVLDKSEGHLLDFQKTLETGNRQIYNNIAPAAKIFLEAETAGQDGVAALRKAGYGQGEGKRPLDPKNLDNDNYVIRAFELYQKAQNLPDGPERAGIAEQANAWLGLQEQWNILQPLFDPLQTQFGGLSTDLKLTDVNGVHQLLPKGGNWAIIHDRLGLPKGLRQPGPRDPLPSLANPPAGTILSYFKENLIGAGLRGLHRPHLGGPSLDPRFARTALGAAQV